MRGTRQKDFLPITRALSVQKKVSENTVLCIKHNFQLKLVCSIHSVALLNITLFKSKKIRCALSALQKECRKVWGARYTLGARYRSENTIIGSRNRKCLIISRSVLLRMRNVSDKSCRENQNTHFVFSNSFSENRAVYEIMGKILQSGAGHKWQYGACALHAGYLRLHTHTQNM